MLQVLAIEKDFEEKRSLGLASDGIDEEFITYPTAIVCFEDNNFARFYARDSSESSLDVSLRHERKNFGYAVRLKYSRADASTKTTFFSRPIIFKVSLPLH